MNTVLVQLTDLHIGKRAQPLYGRIDTGSMLHAAITSVLQLPQQPDAVIITGDLVDAGSADEYAHVATLLAPLRMPCYLLPGNHDDRRQLRRSFPHHRYLGVEGPVRYTVRIGHLRLIALDTSVIGQPHGELDDGSLDWLAAELDADPHTPVIVAMHHPPFQTLIGHMDKMGLQRGEARFAELVAAHPNIERIVCGHLHRAIDVRYHGTIASTAPSTAHQISPDFAPDSPAQWSFEPPGFRVHICTPEGRLVTHLVNSGQYPGPYAFEG